MSKLLTKLSVAALVAMSMSAYATTEHTVSSNGQTLSAAQQPTGPVVTSGQVRFQGQVLANTCSVATNSRDVLVKLPAVKANELAKNSESAKGNTQFQITLEGCPLAGYVVREGDKKSNVSIYFDGAAQTVTAQGTLKEVNPAANSAKGVEIQLFNATNQKINLKAGKDAQAQLIKKALNNEENVTFQFSAEYVANGKVEPGFVSTQVPFTIDYQ